MKKILSIFIIGILILSGIGAVALNIEKENNSLTINSEKQNVGSRDYTHTVFVEVCTGQFCGPCYYWNTNLYNTYSSYQYDFEYVEMIAFGFGGWDDILFTQANIWRNLYGINAVPTSIMDGNYQNIIGNYPSQLPTKLNTCGSRTVPNIDANITLTWLGNATIQIAIQIKNNEATTYNGYIRVPITEVVSRYLTAGGDHYHHGFLDYAFPMNTFISISAGGTYTNSVIWNGNLHCDNHGTYFGDITENNIMVILGVFNNNNNYVDETAAATIIQVPPNTPRNPDPSNGQTNVNINVDPSWWGGDPNPQDIVTYDVYFGTSNPPPKVVNNQSSTNYDPGTLNFSTTYYWNIVAWDNNGASATGPIWQFTTRGQSPPYTPKNPSPANGTTNVAINPTLSWSGGDPDEDKCYYDVYFEAENPNPKLVSTNQESTTYKPAQLEYNTTYYWKIVSEDILGAIAEGPVWSFKTMEEPQYFPDLECTGTLQWSYVKAGSTILGTLRVRNVGDPTSELYWNIESYPEWGTWTFDPDHGDALTPEEGGTTVDVTIVAPPNKNSVFEGEVKVINANNASDFEIIIVKLETPRDKAFYINILEKILEKFPNAFPLLKIILGI